MYHEGNCDDCGEPLGNEEIAEVVFIGSADRLDELDDLGRHMIIHQNCFNPDRHVQA